MQAGAVLVNLNPSLKAAGAPHCLAVLQRPAIGCWLLVAQHNVGVHLKLQTWRQHQPVPAPLSACANLQAELAYALNKVGVSTLVMAPELRGTSFVDLVESIRWGVASRWKPFALHRSMFQFHAKHTLFQGPDATAAQQSSAGPQCARGFADLVRFEVGG